MASEKIVTIPLRKGFIKVSKNRRVNKAVSLVRNFLAKHNKTTEEKVKLSPGINEFLWKRGAQKPPSRVKVLVSVDKDGMVSARLPEEEAKKEAK